MHLDDALLTEGRIDPWRWAAARANGAVVGKCHCGADVTADPDEVDFFKRVSFAMSCTAGHEAVLPEHSIVRRQRVTPIYGVWENEDFAAAARERDAAILGERRERDEESVPA